MTELLELSQDDYGYAVTVTLYKAGDSATAEDLSTASSVSLDIGRLDETPIVEDGAVTITTAASGIVTFTPLVTWFTETALKGNRYFNLIFKVAYASGVKRSFKIPFYIHAR